MGYEPVEEPDCEWGAASGQDAWDEENNLVEEKKTIDVTRKNSEEKQLDELMQVDGRLEPDWRREFKDHYKIRATYDTGAAMTIFTENMVPGMEVRKRSTQEKNVSWPAETESRIKEKRNCRAKRRMARK